MAGRGWPRAGFTYGETDEVGLQTDKDKAVDTYDLHATVLHLMGLDSPEDHLPAQRPIRASNRGVRQGRRDCILA